MNPSERDKKLDELITRAISRQRPQFDFDKWRKNHQKEIQDFESQVGEIPRSIQRFEVRRIIMKSRITKLAAAAVIIIAVVVAVDYLGVPVDGSSVAWGDLVEHVEQTKTVIYRMKMSMKGMPGQPEGKTMEMEAEIYISSEYGMRMDGYTEGKLRSQAYVLLAQEELISLSPEQKQYMRMKLTDEMLEKMRRENGDPKKMVEEFMRCDYTELGRKEINGIQVEGIESTDPRIAGGMVDNVVGRLWVDVRTDLPVLMEMEASSDDGSMQIATVIDDFEWDIDLDASEFEPNISADYTLTAEVQMPQMDGAGAIDGLRLFSEITGGKYPSTLSGMDAFLEVGQVLKQSREDDPNTEPNRPPSKQELEEMMSLQMTFVFYANLVKEGNDPAYYGDRVTADDADAVLMRWEVSDGRYRVIYGDLTTEDVTVDRLAELEKPFPE